MIARPASAHFLAVFGLGSPSFDPLNLYQRIPFGDFTSVPCLAVGATNDGVVPFADQQDIYAQAGSPSMVCEIIGGNHSQYTDSGQLVPLDGIATIPLQTQLAIARRYMIAFFGTRVQGRTATFAPYVHSGATLWGDTRLQNHANK